MLLWPSPSTRAQPGPSTRTALPCVSAEGMEGARALLATAGRGGAGGVRGGARHKSEEAHRGGACLAARRVRRALRTGAQKNEGSKRMKLGMQRSEQCTHVVQTQTGVASTPAMSASQGRAAAAVTVVLSLMSPAADGFSTPSAAAVPGRWAASWRQSRDANPVTTEVMANGAHRASATRGQRDVSVASSTGEVSR